MAVKLRLKRFGKKKKPFYRLVAAHSTNQRDGKSLELLGTYDPLKDPVAFQCKEDRVKYWLSVGAIPSDSVARLLGNSGVISKPKKTSSSIGLSKKKRKEIAENGGIDESAKEAEAPKPVAEAPKVEETPKKESSPKASTEEKTPEVAAVDKDAK
ncbi:30S ribosomal protein S16 [Candidatus Marinamargulisbacteria bacterium SCGC AAA071-K20]|nr:30S ribosomal protein S16 [Candidatus Marinamargulisbacteria bacterium SCGC AAA071-K20]